MNSNVQSSQADSASDLELEQAYVDHAFECLEASKGMAVHLRETVESRAGGTHQARYERDVIEDQVARRLSTLEIGDRSLCFGRLDLEADAAVDLAASDAAADPALTDNPDDPANPPNPTYYVGRLGVWDAAHNPVVVDWRAPISAPFYRATGRDPQGVFRRRHFASRGRQLLRIEDEYLADLDPALAAETIADSAGRAIRGIGTVREFLAQSRTGQLADIVATIQAEQDEIIRADLPGVLVVQGGPGTGKTVVALHRAAYLLYTHRFPLEGQGVLIAAPNRLFANYIEVVLPSLGEAGAQVATLAETLKLPQLAIKGYDPEPKAKIKGDRRMARLIRKAIADRCRPLRRNFHSIDWPELTFTVAQSRELIDQVRRQKLPHNTARKQVEAAFYNTLAALDPHRTVDEDFPYDAEQVESEIGHAPEVRRALDWMWPTLTAPELLRDLFGHDSLLRSAGGRLFGEAELELLKLEGMDDGTDAGRNAAAANPTADPEWTMDDVALLDEAQYWLDGKSKIRTYGHVVADEAQDLSPMQLRMLARRSLNGSMTLVGDMAQSTSTAAFDSWGALLGSLPQKWPRRVTELSVGYRLPAPISDFVSTLLDDIDPTLKMPVAVQRAGAEPVLTQTDDVMPAVVAAVREELEQETVETVVVIVPDDQVAQVAKTLQAHGVDCATAYEGALMKKISVLPVRFVKGIEVDVAIVVEPLEICEHSSRGLQLLYVALTRAIRRLVVIGNWPLG